MTDIQELVGGLVEKYGHKRENLLPVLQGIIEKERSLSDFAMVEVAKQMGISAADVYGTATFYSFMDTAPRGRYVIRVCKTITCFMKGKNQILLALEDALKVKLGETTPDRRFTLLETNCLGWCHKAPAMLINDEIFTDLTIEKVHEIIGEYKNK
ncbi:MAG: NADH-quinone oxidoreductase subunit NuoE [Salinivirgaceae bacterium]